MPVSAIKAQLRICTTLTKKLRRKFPSGLVIPFGAAISGHGTLTSDCDICLLTRPSEQERALFTPPNYQPQDLKPLKSLLSTPPPPSTLPLTPSSPTRAVASPLTSTNTNHTAGSPSTSTTAAIRPPVLTTTTTSSPLTSSGGCQEVCSPRVEDSPAATAWPWISMNNDDDNMAPFSSHFDSVVSALHGMADSSRIQPIRRARCPMVGFSYKYRSGSSTKLIRCDLSIDNL